MSGAISLPRSIEWETVEGVGFRAARTCGEMASFVVHADEVPIGHRVDSSRLAMSPQPGGYPVAPDKFIDQKPESRYRNPTSKI